ncbi:MAG TPA: thioredoxin family protein [Pirellulaceae bacterium]|nr:thioredoxin family protein [Pirellulaceae bacterium]HMO90661.1 thioredoxin family protein [Pirellulaceae bacterium]HMP67760.1 thioredoxin family protein [Pirellulaceae bacterium]
MYRYLALFALCGMLASTAIGQNNDDLKLKAGDAAPDFKATATCGTEISLANFKEADVVVVVFNCNTCPVAIAYEDRINEFAKNYKDRNVAVVTINNHRSETVDDMKKRAEDKGFVFPYAYEGSGDSARAYGAKVTPHIFVLNSERKIAYQGAFDDSQKNPQEHYVVDAVESLLSKKEVKVTYKPAFGCSIKFK